MTKISNILAGAATILALSAAATAANLSEQYSKCVDKFANPKAEASVMLECNAADGKLNGCKVVEAPTPANGFDKAAICVADALPIGSKTGTIRVPLKFNPS